jgi:hypothetical protein
MTYIAKHTVTHNGVDYAPGDPVDDIKGKDLERLIEFEAVEQAIPIVEPEEQDAGHWVHELSASEAIEHVEQIEDPDILDELETAERAHPKYEAGRETVLRAIAARREALAEGGD